MIRFALAALVAIAFAAPLSAQCYSCNAASFTSYNVAAVQVRQRLVVASAPVVQVQAVQAAYVQPVVIQQQAVYAQPIVQAVHVQRQVVQRNVVQRVQVQQVQQRSVTRTRTVVR